MALSLRNLDRICLAAVILVSLLCCYLVANYWREKHRKTKQENDLVTKTFQDLTLAEENLKRIRNSLGLTKAGFEELNERIPESAEIGEFLRKLDALAKGREITLISVLPLAAVKEALYTKIPIRLIFKGSFSNVYRLLSDIETMNRAVLMEKLVISRSGETQECQVDLTGSVFER